MDSRPPRPGFASGFVPTFARALRPHAARQAVLLLALVLALPAVLALLLPKNQAAQFALVAALDLQFLVPITALLFGTGVLVDEASGGNLPYLFTRPVPRSSVLLGKLAAGTLLGAVGLAISLTLTLLLLREVEMPAGFHGRAYVALLLALPAYLAVFTMLSMLTKWGLLIGFLYAFGVEGVLGLIPGMVKKVTLLNYSRAILEPDKWDALPPKIRLIGVGHATTGTALTVLIAVTVVAVALTLLLASKKEFVARTAEAA
jgi:ABC-2 type transport system permease protein